MIVVDLPEDWDKLAAKCAAQAVRIAELEADVKNLRGACIHPDAVEDYLRVCRDNERLQAGKDAANARADAAEKKLAKATELLDRSRANAGNLLVRMEAAEAEVARLRKVLEMVEWLWIGDENQSHITSLICPWCKQGPGHPWCGEMPGQGHQSDCARQAALQDAPGKKEGE